MTTYSQQAEKFGIFTEEYMGSSMSLKDLLGKSHKTPNDNLICLFSLTFQQVTTKEDALSPSSQKRIGKIQKYFSRFEKFADEPKNFKQLDQKIVSNFFVLLFVNCHHFSTDVRLLVLTNCFHTVQENYTIGGRGEKLNLRSVAHPVC